MMNKRYALAAMVLAVFVGVVLYSEESEANPAKILIKGAQKLLPKLAGKTMRIAAVFGRAGIFRIPKVHRAFAYLRRSHPKVARYLKIATGIAGGAGSAAGTQALIEYLESDELFQDVEQIRILTETLEQQGEMTQQDVNDLEGLLYGLSYALDAQKETRAAASIWDIPEKAERDVAEPPQGGWETLARFARILRKDPVATTILIFTVISAITTFCCIRLLINEAARRCRLAKGRTERRRARNRLGRRRKSGSSSGRSHNSPPNGEEEGESQIRQEPPIELEDMLPSAAPDTGATE
ncbi:Hypothetical predicted protein [Paramuricea clavata]|uniref:Uncharacterized protein n=1 Tax=Paramuricea clavata TaxID=317549 RepID=A0A6S7K731_PARCT|nr:Hypothetical predicted protein [Paramuricea clavata]